MLVWLGAQHCRDWFSHESASTSAPRSGVCTATVAKKAPEMSKHVRWSRFADEISFLTVKTPPPRQDSTDEDYSSEEEDGSYDDVCAEQDDFGGDLRIRGARFEEPDFIYEKPRRSQPTPATKTQMLHIYNEEGTTSSESTFSETMSSDSSSEWKGARDRHFVLEPDRRWKTQPPRQLSPQKKRRDKSPVYKEEIFEPPKRPSSKMRDHQSSKNPKEEYVIVKRLNSRERHEVDRERFGPKKASSKEELAPKKSIIKGEFIIEPKAKHQSAPRRQTSSKLKYEQIDRLPPKRRTSKSPKGEIIISKPSRGKRQSPEIYVDEDDYYGEKQYGSRERFEMAATRGHHSRLKERNFYEDYDERQRPSKEVFSDNERRPREVSLFIRHHDRNSFCRLKSTETTNMYPEGGPRQSTLKLADEDIDMTTTMTAPIDASERT